MQKKEIEGLSRKIHELEEKALRDHAKHAEEQGFHYD